MSERPKSDGKAGKPRESLRPSKAPKRVSILPKKAAAAAKGRSIPPAAAKSVLVVEDDTAIRELIVKSLSSRYRVHQAKDGLAAAELLDSIDVPDLLLCDIMMPRVDGLSLVRMIRGSVKLKGIPIIFLTAKGAPEDVVKGINAGARHYLSKPFSMKILLEKVANLIGDT